jgi:hypothetical protein
MPRLIREDHYDRPLYFYDVGDRVRSNYGPQVVEKLVGVVTEVVDRPEGEHGEPESQTLTVDWIVLGGFTVAQTIEYPQDLEPVWDAE